MSFVGPAVLVLKVIPVKDFCVSQIFSWFLAAEHALTSAGAQRTVEWVGRTETDTLVNLPAFGSFLPLASPQSIQHGLVHVGSHGEVSMTRASLMFCCAWVVNRLFLSRWAPFRLSRPLLCTRWRPLVDSVPLCV